MNADITKLPMVNGNHLLGIVTERNLNNEPRLY
jgi:hypothetical protein